MIHSCILIAQADGLPLPAAAAPGTSEIVTIGFLFVMLVLSALAVVTSIIGLFFTRAAARSAKRAEAVALAKAEVAERALAQSTTSTPATTTVAASATTDEGEESTVLFAVIAAAVHSVIGDRPHRVISIRRDGPGWAQEGRRQIFSSHRVR